MNTVYSVSQINSYIRNMFAQDYMLRRVSVSGEVSNCTYHRSGHIYFTIKDARAAISCIMFASARGGLAFRMKEGDRIVVHGSVDVYERDGRYQLYAQKIEQAGAGLLYEKFLRLKKELEEMGMFDPMYKQPIPAYVRKLGVVTAPTGAAIQDIRNIAGRRNPYIQIILYPALVQGEDAAESIARGLEVLDQMHLDCIIVGRGGGSIEDLWAFNEELVARAIFACSTPVISAVGHETDTTIADFVADLRAPTPSAAAELAVADVHLLLAQLERYERRLQMGMAGHVDRAKELLAHIQTRLSYLTPQRMIEARREKLRQIQTHMEQYLLLAAQRDREQLRRTEERLPILMEQKLRNDRERLARIGERLPVRMERIVGDWRHQLQLLIARYEGLSPLTKLNQGYARAECTGGKAVSSVHDVRTGERMEVYVRDGRISAAVLEVVEMELERG